MAKRANSWHPPSPAEMAKEERHYRAEGMVKEAMCDRPEFKSAVKQAEKQLTKSDTAIKQTVKQTVARKASKK